MSHLGGVPEDSPFHPENARAFERWKEWKLSVHPKSPAGLVVTLSAFPVPAPAEEAAIRSLCKSANMAIYDTLRRDGSDSPQLAEELKTFAARFGLTGRERHRSMRDHELVDIRVAAPEERPRQGFIPYTTRRLLWHTDGYYKYGYPGARPIRAMLLHCVRQAKEGGENELLDPEIAYLRLREMNPDYIRALMAPDAMTIPEFVEEDGSVRPESKGPVFWVDAGGNLNMRYTERSRNIVWASDETTRKALDALRDLLHGGSEPFLFRVRLKPGQGLVCNNVLHTRTAFVDHEEPEKRRLLYRGRYTNRVSAPNHAAA